MSKVSENYSVTLMPVYLQRYHTNNLQMKKTILPKVHYSLEHLAHFIMGATNNFCTWVQHCLVLLLV